MLAGTLWVRSLAREARAPEETCITRSRCEDGMKAHRTARVAEVVREVASETILYELRDPRVRHVTVTRTEVSGDLQHAKVYVSVMGTEQEQQLTMHGLKHAAGFIQARLGKRLQTRFTPSIHFVL